MFKDLTPYLLVASGGALGSVARYAVSLSVHPIEKIPVGTLAVNLAGCFLIGVVAAADEVKVLSPEQRVLFATGFCGGFTTFSALAFETLTLLNARQWLIASAYLGVSFFGGLLAVYLGMLAAKSVLK